MIDGSITVSHIPQPTSTPDLRASVPKAGRVLPDRLIARAATFAETRTAAALAGLAGAYPGTAPIESFGGRSEGQLRPLAAIVFSAGSLLAARWLALDRGLRYDRL